mmetsp:Transcript_10606/g.10453  ORF Transcript_10606/g.10453 Transcript_10606/m.10453 type:complete len:116 (-) Transcript_10606:600-947(-)
MFIDEEETDFSSVKLIDFGLSAKFQDLNSRRLSMVAGSPYFTAPEVFEKNYDEACDVWSLGVVLYILLSGEYPYKADDLSELREKLKEKDVDFPLRKWNLASDSVQDLLTKMLDR